MPKSRKTARIAATRRSQKQRDRDEWIHMQLIGAHAAVLTAVRCVEHKGPLDDALATNLRRAALDPLERAMAVVGTARS